ncbi:hypothetical protein ACU4GD_28260 [Cupriavidus basilensis]
MPKLNPGCCWALVLALLGTYGLGRHQGAAAGRQAWQAKADADARKVAEQGERAAEKTVQVVTQYVDRVQVIREKAKSITKEVPIYVPSDSCPMPGGFRVLHDAAARGELPDPAGVADAPAAPAQDVAATVSDNYGTCHATAEQLRALQEWVRRQAAVAAGGGEPDAVH